MTASLRTLGLVARHELRGHLGRIRFALAWAALAALAQLLWMGTASDATMLRIGAASAAYDAPMLSLVYASELGLWLGLLGFLVVRAPVRREWQEGLGSVLGALPVADADWVLGRWLGAVGALALLSLGTLGAVMLVHAAHVAAPLEPAVYLRTWCWLTVPALLFAASMATLSDALAGLVGRLGDVVFFVAWWTCAFLMAPFWQGPGAASHPLLALDFPGHFTAATRLAQALGDGDISLGGRASFNAALPFVHVPADLAATPSAWWLRAACALLACTPLLAALRGFHRWSPDLRPGEGRGASSLPARWLARLNAPLALLNRAAAPLRAVVRPLLALAARHPGPLGQVLAEAALTLAAQPAAIALLPVCWALGLVPGDDDGTASGGALRLALVAWGAIASVIASREHEEGWSALGRAAPGGLSGRHWRQWGAAFVLGLACLVTFLVVRLAGDPLAALALAAVLATLASLAVILGQLARAPRPFLFLLLLAALVLDRLDEVAALDWFGTRHAVSPSLLATEAALAAGLALAGPALVAWRERRPE